MRTTRSHLTAGLFAALGALTTSAVGHAEPAVARVDWYGWQTLVVHGVCLGTAGGLGFLPDSQAKRVAIPVALGAASLAGPVVQMAHGHVDKALISFGLQIGASFMGFIAAESLGCEGGCSKAKSLYIGYLGLGIGSLVGVAVDAALFGWDEPLRFTERRWRPAAKVTPTAAFSPGVVLVGAGGLF